MSAKHGFQLARSTGREKWLQSLLQLGFWSFVGQADLAALIQQPSGHALAASKAAQADDGAAHVWTGKNWHAVSVRALENRRTGTQGATIGHPANLVD